MQEIRFNPLLSPPLSTVQKADKPSADPGEFSKLLNEEIQKENGIKFSKHAQSRLVSRNISLESGDVQRLGGAVDKAAQKGVQDSLIVMDDLAFIVSVPDKTVVTAMPVDEAKENVFTNINGAVIV
jgi:flagellar operon protein